MRRTGYCSGGRASLLLGAILAAGLAGCGESPDTDNEAKPGPSLPGQIDEGPVRLSYVCGNRFLITNAYSVPVSVTFRILGSEEDGSASLPAAPSEDPAFSEQMIETRSRGAVQIFLDGKLIAARPNDGIPCTPTTPAPAVLSASTATSGQWSAPFTWPVVALHASLLPNGKVLSFGHAGSPQVWDPSTGKFTAVPSPAVLFCAGHALLSDGRVLVAGGHITDDHGLPNITYFSASGNVWSSGTPMARGRWYPTTTTMGTGEVVILAGRDQDGEEVTTPEVWKNGAIRQLTGAKYQIPYYPRAFLAPNGKLFVAGERQTSRYLSLSGSGSWSNSATRKFGVRDYGSAVMYDDGKILYAGGGRSTNTAEIIDLNSASPAWQWTGAMAYARRHLNATVLPTGEVLVTGGVGGTAFNDLTAAVRTAELWSPASGQWTTLASSIVARGYHATSLLLPDGRVLHTGSGDGGGAPNERTAEIFSPPYLFAGARPVIQSAPSSVGYGSAFTVKTAQASSITKISFIRLGSVTHAFNTNQRFQKLSFTRSGSDLIVTAPGNKNRTPPGHYMLFVLNGSNVPSVAKIVRIK